MNYLSLNLFNPTGRYDSGYCTLAYPIFGVPVDGHVGIGEDDGECSGTHALDRE